MIAAVLMTAGVGMFGSFTASLPLGCSFPIGRISSMIPEISQLRQQVAEIHQHLAVALPAREAQPEHGDLLRLQSAWPELPEQVKSKIWMNWKESAEGGVVAEGGLATDPASRGGHSPPSAGRIQISELSLVSEGGPTVCIAPSGRAATRFDTVRIQAATRRCVSFALLQCCFEGQAGQE